ncbi:hypothetical protein CHUAL_011200 [Chamberlinius hualienensis]
MWAIFLTFITPEIFTFGRSIRIIFFKTVRKSLPSDFLIALLFESLHTVGVAILVLIALPELDVIKGAMLGNCLCFAPGVISLLTRAKSEHRIVFSIFDGIAVCAQATGFFVWPYLMSNKLTNGVWAIPVGLFLTSLGWWENYVDARSEVSFIKYLVGVKERLYKRRYFVYAFIPFIKILLFFICMLLADYLHNSDQHGWDMFPMLHHFISLQTRQIEVDTVNLTTKYFADTYLDGSQLLFQAEIGENIMSVIHTMAIPKAAILTWTIQFLCAWMCYVTAKFACRICIQGFSFALPLNVAIPVTVTLLISFCGIKDNDVCFMKDMLPRYLFWVCPEKMPDNIFIDRYAMWIWLLWLISQTWITLHIWLPKCERLAPTEKLFVTPMYSGCFIAPSLVLNRRRFEDDVIDAKILEGEIASNVDHYETIKKPIAKEVDQITNIIACATMWHETDEEMVSMFKSILRMDEDQCARRMAQKYLRISDPDYYEFETQILFDDAFEVSDDDWDQMVINRFVKSAIKQVDEAARQVHHCDIHIRPPTMIPTLYGGRLVWTLPGKTQMIIHLKDKSRIRHRKRWSQVMYMYYLLGFKIMATQFDADYKTNLAHNTYLLALDGDIDFKPSAVRLLVDLMKKNPNLGASCGRIHPVGSGMMVWYQKFEYAIGHWLQKATEHMIGCVLCSPGCFSLFRARALMDDNVMKKYTTKPSEARHYVQYDQGEDRWLCTLLLQRGYRVEYSAASDAYTHAPEGFAEFFNQRRRWVPSTMANILDLLQDSKRTVAINNNISSLYIIYQGMLMVGTVLGPGTIFLMMIAAFVSAFSVPTSTAFYFNAIPLLIFIIMCFAAKPNNQVLCAQILTCFYAIVMLAVMVGIFIQIAYSGWSSPTTFLTLLLPVTMCTAAILHPLEFTCLLWGWLYWLVIPSMYLLLIIYSYMNMNNVSWGTREVQVKKSKQEMEEEQKKVEAAKDAQKNMVFNIFGLKEQEKLGSGFAISCAHLCSFSLCTHKKPDKNQVELMAIQGSLKDVTSKLALIEKSVDYALPGFRRRSTRGRSLRGNKLESLNEEENEDVFENDEEGSIKTESSAPTEAQNKRNPIINPLWIEDNELVGPVDYLSKEENLFWKNLIEKYLYPIDEDPEEKARIVIELKELRNKVVFAFFMLNAIFIVIVLLLQINKDILYINWPLGISSNITWTDTEQTLEIAQIYQHIQPIGFVFMIFFAVVIIIQFIGMLFHRFETLSHILASTVIKCLSAKPQTSSPELFLQENGVEIARQLQRAKGNEVDEIDGRDGSIDRAVGRRKTIHDIERSKYQKKKTASLDQIFRERYMSLSLDPNRKDGAPVLNKIRKLSMRRGTVQLLANRRNSTISGAESAAGSRPSMQSNSMYEGTQRRPSSYIPNGRISMDLRKSINPDVSGRVSFIGSADMDTTV